MKNHPGIVCQNWGNAEQHPAVRPWHSELW